MPTSPCSSSPPTARVEGGCKGTLRAEVSTKGIASHSARPWKGHNAIHDAAEVLARLVAYEPVTRVVDELEYREALNAVLIDGGVATNVIPDRCVVTVNYRYAPSLSERRGRGPRAPGVRRLPGRGPRQRRRGPARAAPARGQGLRRGARPAGRGQAGLDRRRAVLGDRGAGRQLRTRRPEPGPHGRRAVPGGAVRRLRGRPAPLARPDARHTVAPWTATPNPPRPVDRDYHQGPVVMRRLEGARLDDRPAAPGQRGARPTGCTPTRGGSCASSPSSSTGFGALAEVGPAVSVFGSARTRPDHPDLRSSASGSAQHWSRPATR